MEEEKTKKDVICTGVREIDEKLGGGIPIGSLALIEGQSDSGKSVLSQHLAYGALTTAQSGVVYYTTENTAKSLISQMDSLSLFSLDYFLTDRLRIYPLSVQSDLKTGKNRFLFLSEHFEFLPSHFKLVIVDSITLLVAHSNPVDVIDFFWACKRECDIGRSVLLVAHSYAFEEEMLSRSRSLCDAHFRLKLEQIGDRFVKIMEVLKVRGADRPTGEVVTFDIEPKTGMRIIPMSKARV
ncbi:ATPase domain-containing protein [Chloroflexota bacterium]